LIIHHADHGIGYFHRAQIKEALEEEGDGFFIKVIPVGGMCPPGLKCGLRGPAVGDGEIKEAEMVVRGNRAGPSRMTHLPPLEASEIVAIGIKRGEELELFTAYGTTCGVVAPREPWDPSLDEEGRKVSQAFWAVHALSLEA